jgi:diguanylate cyclase (GGDEF)-like protein/PAS domain S-box-containing protein
MIEDHADDTRQIEMQLAEAQKQDLLPSLKVQWEKVAQLAAAEAYLAQNTVDSFLIGVSNLEDLYRLSSLHVKYPDLNVMACVNLANEPLALLALEQGASNYVLIDAADPRYLASVFRHALENTRLNSIRQRLHWVEDTITEVVWRALPDLSLVEITPSINRLAGFSVEEALKMTLHDFTAPDFRKSLLATLRTLQEACLSSAPDAASWNATLELMLLRKDGAAFWVEISTHAMVDLQGHLIGLAGVMHDITARHAIQDKLDYFTHDALTGLFNQTYFREELDRLEFSRLYPISVLVVDFKGLNLINLERGMAVGDELLKRVANLLRMTFRSEDLVARTESDEFVAIMPRTDARATSRVLQRVINMVAAFNQERPDLPLRLSLDVATAEPGQSLLETLKYIHIQKLNSPTLT